MSKLKKVYLKCMERLMRLAGKDYMPYRIEKYRLNGATIGEHVRAFSPISSHEPYLLTIGDNVTVATGVSFITHDNSAIKLFDDATDFVGPITIGRNVFIGANSTLLPGVTIADDCVIGAGSVVTRSCPDQGTVIAGNPAKPVGSVEKMREKYAAYKFDFRHSCRRTEILNHRERWLSR